MNQCAHGEKAGLE